MSRPFNDYPTDKVVLQVPKELKCELKELLTPIVKKRVEKWKKARKKEQEKY